MSVSASSRLPGFSRALRVLDEGVELGWHSGAQLSVRTSDGQGVDLASGSTLDDSPMTTDHLAPLFCTAKPLLVIALAQLVTQGRIGWDDPLARYVPGFGRHGKEKATLRHALVHSIGLATDPVELLGLPWGAALSAICRARVPRGWAPGTQHAYLPFTSWYLMGDVVARVTGRDLSEVLRTEVLTPLGLHDTYVGMTAEQFAVKGPLVAGAGTRQVRGDPADHRFRLPVDDAGTCCDVGPASARAPMRDLARLYAAIGLAPKAPPGVAEQVWAEVVRRPRQVYDHRHQVWSRLGTGIVFEGRDLGESSRVFGPDCSTDTLGHRGLGSVLAYADPREGIAVAAFFDITNESLMNRARIDRTSASVYEDWRLHG